MNALTGIFTNASPKGSVQPMNTLRRYGALALAAALVALTLTAVSQQANVQPAQATNTVNLSGNPSFDSDSIATSASGQPRWDSLPGSRWGFGINGNAPING